MDIPCVCLIFLVVVSTVRGKDTECKTPEGELGVCKPLSECPSVQHNLNTIDEKSQEMGNTPCGNNSTEVCCKQCYTPDNQLGVYAHMRNCPHIIDFLQKRTPTAKLRINEKFLKKSRVGKSTTFCCGPAPEVQLHECNRQIGTPPPTGSKCCGILHNKGVNDSGLLENPWTVDLEYQSYGTTIVVCKGALISNRYVLSAAHCVNRRTPTNVIFGYNGKHCTELPSGNNGENDVSFCVPIEYMLVHSEYDRNTHHDDIALLRLKHQVMYTEYARPICLPPTDAAKNQLVLVSGRNSEKHVVRMNPVSLKECQDMYAEKYGQTRTIWDKQICAGGEKDKDACRGDSGGPLMQELGGRFELAGLISYGSYPCGVTGVPGVYTRVFSYMKWIMQSMLSTLVLGTESSNDGRSPANLTEVTEDVTNSTTATSSFISDISKNVMMNGTGEFQFKGVVDVTDGAQRRQGPIDISVGFSIYMRNGKMTFT